MTPAAEAFRIFIDHLAPSLKTDGFSRRGNSFSKLIDKNLAAVEFQRSPDKPTNSAYVFFVNLGVVSRLVYWFETGHSRIPNTEKDYHWWERLGNLVPDKAHWGWHVESHDAIAMAEGILEALEQYGLPILERHVSDDALMEGWTRSLESRPGGDIRPLLRLSVLAAAYGHAELNNRALAKLREQCEDEGWPPARIQAHVEKLNHWNW